MHTSPSDEHEWPKHFQPAAVQTGFGGGRLSTYCLALEAWRRGLSVTFLAPDATTLSITDGRTTVRLNHSRSGNPKSRAYATTLNKYRTSEALRAHGVPVPDSHHIKTKDVDYSKVSELAASIGYPVVLKPLRGTMGRGVFANITDDSHLKDSYNYLVNTLHESSIVLERHHVGEDARVIVVGERYIAACQRIPANVIGDGKSTVRSLITAKNAARRRNPFLSGGLISIDFEVKEMISRADYTLESIPKNGEYLRLREKNNGSAGGDVLDITDKLPNHVKQGAVEAVKAIPGLRTAGVDLLWDEDFSPTSKDTIGGFAVIEMNSRPHIGLNMYPMYGKGRDLPKAIIDEHFPASSRPNNSLARNTTFDYQLVASSINSGVVNHSTLEPLPEHGYPVRRRYAISPGLALRKPAKNSLVRLARELGIVYRIQLSGARPRVTVGASTAANANKFIDKLAVKLGEEPNLLPQWRGPLYVGFSTE